MIIGGINLDGYVHGKNLYNKADATKDSKLLAVFEEYVKFRKTIEVLRIMDRSGVEGFMQAFNDYRAKVAYIFEKREHSGQENLRSSMLEESFVHLFKDLVVEICGTRPENLHLGKGSSYVDLTFVPVSLPSIFNSPNAYFHLKDQDFLLGARFLISIRPDVTSTDESSHEGIVIPVVVIECKTYLERNMLDTASGTASRIKRAMPYCLYIVASEYLKMEVAYPELTDIDEVFVLCKASNSERLQRFRDKEPVHLIDSNLAVELFEMVHRHLNRIWWKPEDVLRAGRVIGRNL